MFWNWLKNVYFQNRQTCNFRISGNLWPFRTYKISKCKVFCVSYNPVVIFWKILLLGSFFSENDFFDLQQTNLQTSNFWSLRIILNANEAFSKKIVYDKSCLIFPIDLQQKWPLVSWYSNNFSMKIQEKTFIENIYFSSYFYCDLKISGEN